MKGSNNTIESDGLVSHKSLHHFDSLIVTCPGFWPRLTIDLVTIGVAEYKVDQPGHGGRPSQAVRADRVLVGDSRQNRSM
jgi:hypothetical protein